MLHGLGWSDCSVQKRIHCGSFYTAKFFDVKWSSQQTKYSFYTLFTFLFSHPPVIWLRPVPSLPHGLSSLCHLPVNVILIPCPPFSHQPPETALLWLQHITLTVGPNCSIIFHVISHPCDIKIPTMTVKSKEMDAIYHSETLCSHTVLDKVLTGNKKAAIVKRMSSPNTLLAKIVFWHGRPDMLVSFDMSLVPLAFFLLPAESVRCLSAWTINKISAGRRATKTSASRCCNIICLRWQWVSKWKTCEVSVF